MAQRKKPSALKAFEGWRSHGKKNHLEPVGAELDPAVPPELEGNVEAIAEWQRVITSVIARRQVTLTDRGAAIMVCKAWSKWLELSRKADTQPHIVETKTGRWVTNPSAKAANEISLIYLKFCIELGLTPAARSRVQTTNTKGGYGIPKPKPDEWGQLIG